MVVIVERKGALFLFLFMHRGHWLTGEGSTRKK